MSLHRREQDKTPSEIDKLIAETQDIESRAVLFVLNSMAKEINSVAEATLDIEEKLESHIIKDAEVKNKVAGAAKVLAWMIGFAQIVGLTMWVQIRADFKEIATGIAQNRETNVSQEIKIENSARILEKMLDRRQ